MAAPVEDVQRSMGALEGLFTRPKSSFEGLSGEEVTAVPRPMDLLYIRQCTQCSFSVEGKVAKCIIEGAETVSVDFKEPIMSGTLELINCREVKVCINPKDRLLSISVDGCDGVQLHLNRPQAVGGIYCAASQRVSVHMCPPHPTQIQLALPPSDDPTEQWVCSWENGKMDIAKAIREGSGYVTTVEKKRRADARDRELKRRFEAYLRGMLKMPEGGEDKDKQAELEPPREEEEPPRKEEEEKKEKLRLADLSPSSDTEESPLVAEMREKRRGLKPTETVERSLPVVGVGSGRGGGGGGGKGGDFNPAIDSEEEKREFFDAEAALTRKLDRAADWLRASKHAIVFTGAGISTSCGIPDFRSGMGTVLDTGPGVWELRAHGAEPGRPRHIVPILRALPSPSHMAIVGLHQSSHVKFTVSQNVDGLHRRSGLGPAQLAELHGNTNLETCRRCQRQYLRDFETREAMGVFEHGTSRLCDDPACRGVLEDSIINFGENLPERELTTAFEHAHKADLCLVLGSSLRVRPACQVPEVVRAAGGRVILCNLQRIPQFPEDNRTLHAFCKVDDFMRSLAERLGLSIPPFTLLRRARLSSERKGESLLVSITGLDPQEDTPYSFIKGVTVSCDGVTHETSSEPLVLALPPPASPLPLTLYFQGHYREPPLTVTFDPSTGDRIVRMSYDVAKGTWTVE